MASYAQCPICGRISKDGGYFKIYKSQTRAYFDNGANTFETKRCPQHKLKGGYDEKR